MSQFEGSQAGGMLSYSGEGGSAPLFYPGLQLIGQGPPTLGRAIWFTQSTNLNVNLIQKPPRIILAKYLGTLWPSQVDT